MRGKTAKALRRLLEVDLGKGTEIRQQLYAKTNKKYIGVISHDGDHKIREEDVYEARTHPDRHMYRQLKKKYTGSVDVNREIKDDIKNSVLTRTSTKSHKEEL